MAYDSTGAPKKASTAPLLGEFPAGSCRPEALARRSAAQIMPTHVNFAPCAITPRPAARMRRTQAEDGHLWRCPRGKKP